MTVASCAICGGERLSLACGFTAGSLAQCRIFSRYLALQIKALELGLALKRCRSFPRSGNPAIIVLKLVPCPRFRRDEQI